MDLKRKYAEFILKCCLKVTKDTPVIITGYKHISDFVDILVEEAKKIGCTDILAIKEDVFLKRQMLLDAPLEEILEKFNRSSWNEYANKDAAFVHPVSMIPHISDGIDPIKQAEYSRNIQQSIQPYREKQNSEKLPWCIFGVPNEYWAKELFPNEDNSLEKLWDLIYDVCLIKEENPSKAWEDKLNKAANRCAKMNNMNIKTLTYKNTLGTNLTIALPENYNWSSAKESQYIVNMPSEEIFTSPVKDKTEGIVYSTKPLLYNGVSIEDFYLKFSKGKVVEVSAKKGQATLEEMLKMDENASYLGECALVDYNSPISNSKIIFLETLYDENASCHLALGRGFNTSIKDGQSLTKEELSEKGINDSILHTDFMIGDKSLEIVATTKDNKEIPIMKDGNLVI